MTRPVAQTGSFAVSEALYELVEELTDRLQRDAPIELEAVLAAHPEHADELRKVWPSLAMLAGLRQTAGSRVSFPPGAGTGAGALAGEIGDFRIIREVGRGGMGIVYEAEQMSLGRRVALKVLPFAGVLDERQLQRFRNEARAAAGLHHPHIVPVHAVGCERGVHYYAMQFIEGRNLADLVDELRQERGLAVRPKTRNDNGRTDGHIAAVTERFATETRRDASTDTHQQAGLNPRQVAEWTIQVARALDYAHSVGIVHRDVKPSNLMLDSSGQLWITDFGLAQFEADAGLTQSGDILGTLRYMSPEQALGSRGVVDQRADVYSLGATLYELLTLSPLFPDAGRAELLKCIEQEEPLPPRRMNPAISLELETIVLKALAKDAAARYATAGDLADDLQRYLDDRPIAARRPSWRERGWKWARRRRALVGSLIAAVVFSAISLVAAAWIVSSDRQQRRIEQLELVNQTARAQEGQQHRALHDYVTQINLADRALRLGNHQEARQQLASCLPSPGGTDLRGFEWQYLSALTQTSPREFGRHDGPIYHIDIDPRLEQLISGGKDGVRVWDLQAGTLRRHLTMHSGPVNDVKFSPDGTQFCSTSDDGTARIWDSQSLAEIATLPHDGIVAAGRYADEGNLLITTSFSRKDSPTFAIDDRFHYWDVGRFALRREFGSDHAARMTAGDCSDDGRLGASADSDGNVILRNLPDGGIRRTLDATANFREAGNSGFVRSVKFAHRHPWLAVSTYDGTTQLWNIEDGTPVSQVRQFGGWANSLDFSEDDQLMAAGGQQGAEIWMLQGDGHYEHLASAHTERSVWCVRFHDREHLFVATETGEIDSWEFERSDLHERLIPDAACKDVVACFSPDGQSIATAGSQLILRELQDGGSTRVLEPFSKPAPARAIAFSLDGNRLVACTTDQIAVWNVETGRREHDATHELGAIDSLEVTSATSVNLLPSNFVRQEWDIASGRLASSTVHGRIAVHAAHQLSAIERVQYAEDGYPHPYFLDVSLNENTIWKRRLYYVLDLLKFSPDGRWLALGFSAGGFEICAARTGESQGVSVASGASVRLAAFSGDGRTLAVLLEPENSIALWHTDTARHLLTIPTEFSRVSSLEFSHDGQRLLIAGTVPPGRGEVLLISTDASETERPSTVAPELSAR